MVARFHYDDEILTRLLKDKLSNEQWQDVSDHVESCLTCQDRIEAISLDEDTVENIKAFLSEDVETHSPRFEFAKLPYEEAATNPSSHFLEALQFLDPAELSDSLGRFDHRYEIKEFVGRGGMGVVLRGFDTSLARECAIKILAPELATNAAARKRFSREAKSAAAVVHDHVIPIQTVNEFKGLPYLEMPFIRGKSLQQRVSEQEGPLELVEILRIGAQSAAGLAAAHKQGLVHRDVKPANIMLENGVERVLIADFGLARAADDANMTRSHVISGTPQYMSPEQARGTNIDSRSDLFSLGSVMYFMCCGHSPFRASTTMGVLNRIGNEPPRSIREQHPEIPDWLEKIIFKLLEKDPDHRFQSADEVSRLLERWLAHLQKPDEFPAPQAVSSSHSNGWPPTIKWLAGGAVPLFVLALLFFDPSFNRDSPFDTTKPDYPNVSPFTAFVWNGNEANVRINQNWYQLKSFNGVSLNDMIEKCKQEKWDVKKRVMEDHAQVVRLMGFEIGTLTDLELIDRAGNTIPLKNLPMTRQNRMEVLLFADFSGNPFFSGAPGYPKWSAFEGVRWVNEKPHVLVDGNWYELIAIHGVSAEDIIKKCHDEGWDLKHRFQDDLVQILRLMGTLIDKVADLELRNGDGNIVKMNSVPMTREKLRATRDYKDVTADGLLSDLNQFQRQLEAQFAYLEANDFDYESAIKDLRMKVSNETISASQFGFLLGKIVNQFIDGHARVSGSEPVTTGYLPFLIEISGDRYVAVKPDRSGLVSPDHPFLDSFDGKSVEQWLRDTSDFLPKGSRQYCRRNGIRRLRYLSSLRSTLGIKSTDHVDIVVSNSDGETQQLQLKLADERPLYRRWPVNGVSKKIDEFNLGYLRLASMNDEAVRTINAWMPRFESTQGLIVDVRGNGGGIRSPLIKLSKYLLQVSDEPRIGNVAKYRLYREFDHDHLSSARFVYRESQILDERDRQTVASFKKTFKPQWEPQASKFSEWHYLVLSKGDQDREYFYAKPVVVLCDESCFSATDIFLGALKGWPNVTLVGQPSGGGSARTQRFKLDHSGISVNCASMASFQPNGKLYDTNGIHPDVIVHRPPEFYIQGGEDVVLQRAIELLTNQSPQN